MKEKFPNAVLHGYVDECLSDSERKTFEARLCEDKELSTQIETWRAHRDALRVAFGASARELGPAEMGATKRASERLFVSRVEAHVSTRGSVRVNGDSRGAQRGRVAFVARRLVSISMMTLFFLMSASGSA